ncbi:MAG: signal peptidase I [Dehalococcoidia bacterium]
MIATAKSTHTWRPSSAIRSAVVVLGGVLFGLAVGLLLLAFVATRFMGYGVATIQSYSMRPALDRGDLIITRPTSIDRAKAGDIVVFEEGERTKLLIAHRVYNVIPITTNVTNSSTGKTSTSYSTVLRTKGDANENVDEQIVDASRFRGEVLFTVPRIGLLIHDIPLEYVLMGVSASSGLAWGFYELVRYRRRRTQVLSS